ncbi:MAG TPA: adenosylcobinamide-phosphate synthase CbiB [Dissulfurispiraceae bacterium]|nr:adenosylcobinamide-phosphate synthase CbiB [Dissulfurispiraceae bacterium]
MIPGAPNMVIPIEACVLAGACLLDYAIGDPRWLPHPVRLIGAAIAGGESALRMVARSPLTERVAGVALTLVVVAATGALTFAVQEYIFRLVAGHAPLSAPALLGMGALILLAATTIALRGLGDAATLVLHDLEAGNLALARRNLSMIVGRDTERLSESSCAKATIETVSENLSDGVIAPLFYFVIGGLPLAMAYKAVNTLDSMIGYRNDRYRHFGWAAARLDDLANFIPARIAGGLIILSALLSRPASAIKAWRIMRRDSRNHLSPNSGVPEAAMAGALGIRLGGTSTYGGVSVAKPTIGDADHPVNAACARLAVRIMQTAAVLGIGCAVAAAWWFA